MNVSLPQLTLLTNSEPLTAIRGEGEIKLLEEAEYRDETCYRVAVESPDGRTVYWIAKRDGLLRKVEFPSDAFKKKYELTKCAIWAEFRGVRINEPVPPVAFEMEVPSGTKLLTHFLPRSRAARAAAGDLGKNAG